jgi:HTH-type transcriptional regulator/antitoxin HipB
MHQPIKTPTQLGEILRARRKSRQISQAELASKLGISQSRWSTLEADPASLPVERLIAALRLLGLELVVQEHRREGRSHPEW